MVPLKPHLIAAQIRHRPLNVHRPPNDSSNYGYHRCYGLEACPPPIQSYAPFILLLGPFLLYLLFRSVRGKG